MQRQILFKPFLLDSVMKRIKIQTRRSRKLGNVGDSLFCENGAIISLEKVWQEELGDISHHDCYCEGILFLPYEELIGARFHWDINADISESYDCPRKAFFNLIAFVKQISVSELDLKKLVWAHSFRVMERGAE